MLEAAQAAILRGLNGFVPAESFVPPGWRDVLSLVELVISLGAWFAVFRWRRIFRRSHQLPKFGPRLRKNAQKLYATKDTTDAQSAAKQIKYTLEEVQRYIPMMSKDMWRIRCAIWKTRKLLARDIHLRGSLYDDVNIICDALDDLREREVLK